MWTKDGCRGRFECGPLGGSTICSSPVCPCSAFAELNTTLVATIGSVRGGPLAVSTLVRHVLAPLSADLGVLASYDVPWDEPLLQSAKHVWRVPEYTDWEVLVNETLSPFEPDWHAHVRFTPNLWGGLHDMPGSGAIVFALRLVLLRFLDGLVGHVYKTLILTRTDLAYACDHPMLHPSPGEAYAQEGQGADVHGAAVTDRDRRAGQPVSDRHTVFHFDDRHRALAVLPWLVRHVPNTVYAPEIILGWYYADQQLSMSLFPRVNFAVRRPAIDATRWNDGMQGSRPCGSRKLIAKYEREHFLAVQTCGRDPCNSTGA